MGSYETGSQSELRLRERRRFSRVPLAVSLLHSVGRSEGEFFAASRASTVSILRREKIGFLRLFSLGFMHLDRNRLPLSSPERYLRQLHCFYLLSFAREST